MLCLHKTSFDSVFQQETFPTWSDARALARKIYLQELLRRTHGNMAVAAKISKIGRPYLYKMVHQAGIDVDAFRIGDTNTTLQHMVESQIEAAEVKEKTKDEPGVVEMDMRRRKAIARLKDTLSTGRIDSNGLPMSVD